MSGDDVVRQSYLDMSYSRTIQTAANLRKSIFSARGTPENYLLEFYDMFYQLWLMTRYKLITKHSDDIDALDAQVKEWFYRCLDEAKNRKVLGNDLARSGLCLAEDWIEYLNKSGIVDIK